MSDAWQNNDEARRLMLSRIAAAPDAWRARASTAGGFLGAAAAVTLLGLSNQAQDLDRLTKLTAGAAFGLYVLAVVMFLSASVWPPPKPDKAETTDFTASVYSYASKESKPIKWLVLTGATVSALAIGSTALCSILLLRGPTPERVLTSIVDTETRAALEKLCPALPDSFEAMTVPLANGRIRLQVAKDTCGSAGAELVVNQVDTVTVRGHVDG